MKIYIFLIFLSALDQSFASMPVELYGVNDYSYANDIWGDCVRMRFNYKEEIASVNTLYGKIKVQKFQNSQDLLTTISELRQHVLHLDWLSLPQWNNASEGAEIIWEIDRKIFNDVDFIADDYEMFDLEVKQAFLLNQNADDLLQYIVKEKGTDQTSDFYVGFEKRVTRLELCQMYNTLEFKVDVFFKNKTSGKMCVRELNLKYDDEQSSYYWRKIK
jgi:hypothetical protein